LEITMTRSVPLSIVKGGVLDGSRMPLPDVLAPSAAAERASHPEGALSGADQAASGGLSDIQRDPLAAGFKIIHLDAPADVLDACSADGRRVLLFRLQEWPSTAPRKPDIPGAG
jgi:hypothetical protein